MTGVEARTPSRTGKLGWGILIFLATLLALQWVLVYITSTNPDLLNRFLDAPMEEVRQSFPTVADHVVRQGENFAFVTLGFGLFALVVALEGLRHGSRWAWNAYWVVVGTLALIILNTLAKGDSPVLSVVYLALALAGQVLAGWGHSPKAGRED